MEVKTYEEMREYVKDGDVIFFRKNTTLISRIIQWITVSPYFHVAIAFWITSNHSKRLMLVEAQGGTNRRIVNASYYEKFDQDVLRAPKPWLEIEEESISRIGIAKYSYYDALLAGVKDFMRKHVGIRLKVIHKDNPDDEICSDFIYSVIGTSDRRIIPDRRIIISKHVTKERRYMIERRISQDKSITKDNLITPAELFHRLANAGVEARVSLRH